MRTLQKFASVHASVFNLFNQDRSLSSRTSFKMNRAAALGPSGAPFSPSEIGAGWANGDWLAFV
jgi:hypothetical protein